MSDIEQTIELLDTMMSHGIFDAEVIAGNLRMKGWKFVRDPESDSPSGGEYAVQSPQGHRGIVHWYNEEAIEHLTKQAGYFIQGKAPATMFLGWILARELGEIVASIGALIPHLEGVEMPGAIFRRVLDTLKELENG
jgi:hypothetical protein